MQLAKLNTACATQVTRHTTCKRVLTSLDILLEMRTVESTCIVHLSGQDMNCFWCWCTSLFLLLLLTSCLFVELDWVTSMLLSCWLISLFLIVSVIVYIVVCLSNWVELQVCPSERAESESPRPHHSWNCPHWPDNKTTEINKTIKIWND